MLNRHRVMQLHMLIAAFLLPIALIYFIGGALYTMDYKGHIDKQEFTVKLLQGEDPGLQILSREIKQALLGRNLEFPSGDPALRIKKNGIRKFSWSDLKYSVSGRIEKDSSWVQLTYRVRSPLTQIMRVHRAEAGNLFELLNLLLAVGLIATLLSGFYLGISIRKYRYQILIMTGGGVITVISLVVLHY